MSKTGKDRERPELKPSIEITTARAIKELQPTLDMLIQHQIKAGKKPEDIDKVVNDCIDYIKQKATEFASDDQLNALNMIITAMWYSTLRFQIDTISDLAKKMGVSEENLTNELLIEMESQM